jgi:hypothetical protein
VLVFLVGFFGACGWGGGDGCGVEGEGDNIGLWLRRWDEVCETGGLRRFGGEVLGFLVYTTVV